MHRLGRAGGRLAGRAGRRGALLLAWCCAIGPVFAQSQEEIRFDTISDFGGVGLMQMPTARFASEGEFSFATGRVAPYFRNALTMQPLPWAEGVLRYTTIQNRLYGPEAFSGDQALKDKGFDIKFLLLRESESLPQVAVGFRDFAGTGLFSSEYLVLSRRYYDLNFTLGMGWGNLGTRGQIRNPFGWLSNSFRSRSNKTGEGGTLSVQYFHGERASLFGGISYRTPVPGLTLKLELDGNDYQAEGQRNNQKVDSPINLGLTYSYADWLDLSLGIERGNTLMAQLAFRSNLHKSTGMPKFDEPPVKLKPRDLTAEIATDNRATPASEQDKEFPLRLSKALEARNYKVDGVSVKGKRATVKVSQKSFRSLPRAVGRAARIVANEVPPAVEELTYVNMENGLETNRVILLRKDLENAERFEGSPEEIAVNTKIEGPQPFGAEDIPDNGDRYPAFSWGWSPAIRHNYGGPDSPYLYQILLRLDGELQLTRHLSLSGGLGFNIHNNMDQLKLESDSKLPHVRSDVKHYLQQGRNGISRLQLDYLTNLGSNWYGRMSGGIFEEMFGGVGGELLYKPFGKPWALGVDINRVRQRGFEERFSFRDYRVTTGHVDLYYQLPFYNTQAQISAGRYLAGDQGVTVDLSRRFDSGTVFGVFATRTDVSAEMFGEGSFDKGFYISIPMDMLSLYSTRSSLGMSYRPLTRDGGQRLNIGKRLYPIVKNSGADALMRDWNQLLD